eukprot:12685066-Ditylum_brightwellii.AAC.1
MKKSAKLAPATTAMVIYDDSFADLSDRDLLDYEEEMDKKEKVEHSLVPHACEFNTSSHVNQKCNVEYSVPPTVQHRMKASAVNKYVANNSTVSPFVSANNIVSNKCIDNPNVTSATMSHPQRGVIPT